MFESSEQLPPNLELMARGEVPHYVLIFDRSEAARKALDFVAQEGLPELKARLKSPAFLVWQLSGLEFVAIWGTWGYSGGLTVPTKNINALLEEALPVLMERTAEIGGLCMFLVAVVPEYQERILERLAELQPTVGSC